MSFFFLVVVVVVVDIKKEFLNKRAKISQIVATKANLDHKWLMRIWTDPSTWKCSRMAYIFWF